MEKQYVGCVAKFKTWIKHEKTTKYEILFLFEPHFAVWLLIRKYYLTYNREVALVDLNTFFSCSYNRMLVLLYDLEKCGAIKRQKGLENLMLYVSNEEFIFPRRRRITNINKEADEIRSETSIYRKSSK